MLQCVKTKSSSVRRSTTQRGEFGVSSLGEFQVQRRPKLLTGRHLSHSEISSATPKTILPLPSPHRRLGPSFSSTLDPPLWLTVPLPCEVSHHQGDHTSYLFTSCTSLSPPKRSCLHSRNKNPARSAGAEERSFDCVHQRLDGITAEQQQLAVKCWI